MFVLIAFTLNSTLAYAQDVEVMARHASPLHSSFHIPEEFGEVKEVIHQGQVARGKGHGARLDPGPLAPGPVVIHIQDAHGELGAQENIQKILQHLKKEYKVDTLYLEGGLAGEIPNNLLRFTENEEQNNRINRKLLEKGLIGGPELLLLSNDYSGFGSESLSLYKRNLSQFRKVYRHLDEAEEWVSAKKLELSKKASLVFNPALYKFTKDYFLFQDDKRELLSHLNVLSEFSKEHLDLELADPIHQIDFPQLVRFFKLKELQRTADSGQRSDEEKKLYHWLETHKFESNISVFKSFLSTERWTLNADLRSFLESFYKIAKPKGFSFKDYPHLSKELGRMILAQELNAIDLFGEIEQLTKRLLEVLIKSEEERRIVQDFKDLNLLHKLFRLELTRDELGQVQRSASSVQRSEKANQLFLAADRSTLTAAIKCALRFYKTAQLREKSIFRNLSETMKKHKHKKVVLVTGGFHEEGLKKLITKNNFSYISIFPRIHELDRDETYTKVMSLQPTSTVTPVSLGKIDINLMGGKVANYYRRELRNVFVPTGVRSELRSGTQKELKEVKAAADGNIATAQKDSSFFRYMIVKSLPAFIVTSAVMAFGYWGGFLNDVIAPAVYLGGSVSLLLFFIASLKYPVSQNEYFLVPYGEGGTDHVQIKQVGNQLSEPMTIDQALIRIDQEPKHFKLFDPEWTDKKVYYPSTSVASQIKDILKNKDAFKAKFDVELEEDDEGSFRLRPRWKMLFTMRGWFLLLSLIVGGISSMSILNTSGLTERFFIWKDVSLYEREFQKNVVPESVIELAYARLNHLRDRFSRGIATPVDVSSLVVFINHPYLRIRHDAIEMVSTYKIRPAIPALVRLLSQYNAQNMPWDYSIESDCLTGAFVALRFLSDADSIGPNFSAIVQFYADAAAAGNASLVYHAALTLIQFTSPQDEATVKLIAQYLQNESNTLRLNQALGALSLRPELAHVILDQISDHELKKRYEEVDRDLHYHSRKRALGNQRSELRSDEPAERRIFDVSKTKSVTPVSDSAVLSEQSSPGSQLIEIPAGLEKFFDQLTFAFKRYFRWHTLVQVPLAFTIWITMIRPIDMYFHGIGHWVIAKLFLSDTHKNFKIGLPYWDRIMEFWNSPSLSTFFSLRNYSDYFYVDPVPGTIPSQLMIALDYAGGHLADLVMIFLLISAAKILHKVNMGQYRFHIRLWEMVIAWTAVTNWRRMVNNTQQTAYPPGDFYFIKHLTGIGSEWTLPFAFSIPLLYLWWVPQLASSPVRKLITGTALVSGAFFLACPFYLIIYPLGLKAAVTAVAVGVASSGFYLIKTFRKAPRPGWFTSSTSFALTYLALFLNTIAAGYTFSNKDVLYNTIDSRLRGSVSENIKKQAPAVIDDWGALVEPLISARQYSQARDRMFEMYRRESMFYPDLFSVLEKVYFFSGDSDIHIKVKEFVQSLTFDEFVRLKLYKAKLLKELRYGPKLITWSNTLRIEFFTNGTKAALKHLIQEILFWMSSEDKIQILNELKEIESIFILENGYDFLGRSWIDILNQQLEAVSKNRSELRAKKPSNHETAQTQSGRSGLSLSATAIKYAILVFSLCGILSCAMPFVKLAKSEIDPNQMPKPPPVDQREAPVRVLANQPMLLTYIPPQINELLQSSDTFVIAEGLRKIETGAIRVDLEFLRPFLNHFESPVAEAALKIIRGQGLEIPVQFFKSHLKNFSTSKINISDLEIAELVSLSIDLGPQHDRLISDFLIKRTFFEDSHWDRAYSEALKVKVPLIHFLQGQSKFLSSLAVEDQVRFSRNVAALLQNKRKEISEQNIVIFGPERRLVVAAHEEKLFDVGVLQNTVEQFGAALKPGDIFKGSQDLTINQHVKEGFLSALSTLSKERKPATIWAYGHGGENHFWLVNGQADAHASDNLKRPEAVSYREFAEALLSVQPKETDAELGHLVFILDACFAADLAEKMLNKAIEDYANQHNITINSFPTVIAVANHQRYGYVNVFRDAVAESGHNAPLTIETLINQIDPALNSQIPFREDPILWISISIDEIEAIKKELGLPVDAYIKPYLEISRGAGDDSQNQIRLAMSSAEPTTISASSLGRAMSELRAPMLYGVLRAAVVSEPTRLNIFYWDGPLYELVNPKGERVQLKISKVDGVWVPLYDKKNRQLIFAHLLRENATTAEPDYFVFRLDLESRSRLIDAVPGARILYFPHSEAQPIQVETAMIEPKNEILNGRRLVGVLKSGISAARCLFRFSKFLKRYKWDIWGLEPKNKEKDRQKQGIVTQPFIIESKKLPSHIEEPPSIPTTELEPRMPDLLGYSLNGAWGLIAEFGKHSPQRQAEKNATGMLLLANQGGGNFTLESLPPQIMFYADAINGSDEEQLSASPDVVKSSVGHIYIIGDEQARIIKRETEKIVSAAIRSKRSRKSERDRLEAFLTKLQWTVNDTVRQVKEKQPGIDLPDTLIYLVEDAVQLFNEKARKPITAALRVEFIKTKDGRYLIHEANEARKQSGVQVLQELPDLERLLRDTQNKLNQIRERSELRTIPNPTVRGQAALFWFNAEGGWPNGAPEVVINNTALKEAGFKRNEFKAIGGKLKKSLEDAYYSLSEDEQRIMLQTQRENKGETSGGRFVEFPLPIRAEKELSKAEAAIVTPHEIILDSMMLRAPPEVLTFILLHGLRRSIFRFYPDLQAHDAAIFHQSLKYFISNHELQAAWPHNGNAHQNWAEAIRSKRIFGRSWHLPLLYAEDIVKTHREWKRLTPDRIRSIYEKLSSAKKFGLDVPAILSLFKAHGLAEPAEMWRETFIDHHNRPVTDIYLSYNFNYGVRKIIRITSAGTKDWLSTEDASDSTVLHDLRLDIVWDPKDVAQEIVDQRVVLEHYPELIKMINQINRGSPKERRHAIEQLKDLAGNGVEGIGKFASDLLFSISKTHPDRQIRIELNRYEFDRRTGRPEEFPPSDFNYSAFSSEGFSIRAKLPFTQGKSRVRVVAVFNGGELKSAELQPIDPKSGEAEFEWKLPAGTDGWVHYAFQTYENDDWHYIPQPSNPKLNGLVKFQQDVRSRRILSMRPEVFNIRLENMRSLYDENGNLRAGTLEDLKNQLKDIKRQGFGEIYIQALEMGARGEAGPDPSVFSVLNHHYINHKIGGMKALLDLKKVADEVGLEISLDMIPHLSRSNRETPSRAPVWIYDAAAGKPVRRAASDGGFSPDWLDGFGRNWADPQNIREFIQELSALAKLGFNFRIDVGHVFDITFETDPATRGLAKILGQAVTTNKEWKQFEGEWREFSKTLDLNDTNEPSSVLGWIIYEVKKAGLKEGHYTKFYAEQWHGHEARLIQSGVDFPYDPMVANFWQMVRKGASTNEVIQTLRYLTNIWNQYGGGTATIISNHDAEVPPADAFKDAAFAALMAGLFASGGVVFQHIHYSFRNNDGSINWPKAFSEVWRVYVNNFGPGSNWPGKIKETESVLNSTLLGDLGNFYKTAFKILDITKSRPIALDVGHDRVVGIARETEKDDYLLMLSHLGSPYAADINFHPDDLKQNGQGLGKFEDDALYSLEEIFNNEKPDVSIKTPGERTLFTGREIKHLGLGPRFPLPILGHKVFKFNKVSIHLPNQKTEGYKHLLKDSLARYKRYGPRDRFEHSFVARKIVSILKSNNSRSFRTMFEMLSDAVKNDKNINVGDLSSVFHDVIVYEPALKGNLHQALIDVAMTDRTSRPVTSETAAQILRSHNIGEIVITSAESSWSSTTGGLGTQVSDLAKELAGMGISATVIVPVFSDNKSKVFNKYNPKDTGRTVSVQFKEKNTNRIESETVKIYESNISNVRVLFLENNRYFHQLDGYPLYGESAYKGSDLFKARFARMLSLSTLLVIREMNIHASVIQTNDWTTAYVKAYLEGRERIDPGLANLNQDPHLAETKVMSILHNLQKGYQGRIETSNDYERDQIITHGLGFDPARDWDILVNKERREFSVINPTYTAIKTADRIRTVSEGYHDRSLDPTRYDEEFGGIGDALREKQAQGRYDGIPNGFAQVEEQIKYFKKLLKDPEIQEHIRAFIAKTNWDFDDLNYKEWLEKQVLVNPEKEARSFLEMGNESEKRRLARLDFDIITPLQHERLQAKVGFKKDKQKFIYSLLHRISPQKGFQLLLAEIWNRDNPRELKTVAGQWFEEMEISVSLSEADFNRVIQYANQNGRNTLRAAEIAMILMPDLQLIVAGKSDKGGYFDEGFKDIAWRFPDQFRYIGEFIDHDNPLYELISSGSTVFGMPSAFEPGGISNREAHTRGVALHMTRRDGLRDVEIRTENFSEGFEPFNPASWFVSFRAQYEFFKNADLLAERREVHYQAITQDSRWLHDARKYLEGYHVLNGSSSPKDLETLEAAAAINRAQRDKDINPADKLMAAGFTAEQAIDAILTGLRFSKNTKLIRTLTKIRKSGRELTNEKNGLIEYFSKISPEVKKLLIGKINDAKKIPKTPPHVHKRFNDALVLASRSELRSTIRKKDASWWKDPSRLNLAVSLPIFSLRREGRDFGIGKLTDLGIYFRDVLKQQGISTILLLPHYAILDESPYASISSHAINELFIDWSVVEDSMQDKALAQKLPLKERQAVQYPAARKREAEIAMRAYWQFKENHLDKQTQRAKDFKDFISKNQWWLDDYVEFMALYAILGKTPRNSETLESQWPESEIEIARQSPDYDAVRNRYRYMQWIAYQQLKEAIDVVHEAGGRILFDAPMFRSKNSMAVWKFSKFFRDIETEYPGVYIEGYANEHWRDLALWNWNELKHENYRALLDPIGYWLDFGFDGARMDALHFAYDFEGKVGRGDEPGDDFVRAAADIFKEFNALPIAEAFNGAHEAAANLGFLPVHWDWRQVSSHDDPRLYRSAEDFTDKVKEFAFGKNYFSGKYAKFISFALGDQWGDGERIKKFTPDGRQSTWHYRIPLPSDSDYKYRARFNAGPFLANLTSKRSELRAPKVITPEERKQKFSSAIQKILSRGEEVNLETIAAETGHTAGTLKRFRKLLYEAGMPKVESELFGRLNRFKDFIKSLENGQKEQLIAFIISLRDELVLSRSQAYALIHFLHYAGTEKDSNKAVQQALGFSDLEQVSRLLHGRETVYIKKRGALFLIDDQPEIRKFLKDRKPLDQKTLVRIGRLLLARSANLPVLIGKLKEDERSDKVIRRELNIEERIRIVLAVLQGKTHGEIAREFPQILGDLRYQASSASTIGAFLTQDQNSKKLPGALPEFMEALSEKGVLEGGKINTGILNDLYNSLDAVYRAAGAKIEGLSSKANPAEIISALQVFDKKRLPLSRMVKNFDAYAKNKSYPFGLDVAFYAAIEDKQGLASPQLADEIANYFSNFVMPFTDRPVDFMDALLYVLRPSNNYFFTVDEAAQFFSNIFFAIERPDHQRVWGIALAHFTKREFKPEAGTTEWARKLYNQFIRRVFPRARFLSAGAIDNLERSKKRAAMIIDEEKRYDFGHLMDQKEELNRRYIQADQLVREFLEKSPLMAAVKFVGLGEDDLGEAGETLWSAAWDFDPKIARQQSPPTTFYTFAIGALNFLAMRLRKKKGIERSRFTQFHINEETGRAMELEENAAPGIRPLQYLSGIEEKTERISQALSALDANFTERERTVFRLIHALDPEFQFSLDYRQTAEVLIARKVTGTESGSITHQRVEQIYKEVMNRLIHILNTTSPEVIAAWRKMINDPKNISELPAPITAEGRDGAIPLFDNIKLTGYQTVGRSSGAALDGKLVIVKVLRSLIGEGQHPDQRLIVEVNYLGKSLGYSVLTFNALGIFEKEEHAQTWEEAVSYIKPVKSGPRSELRHDQNFVNAVSKQFPGLKIPAPILLSKPEVARTAEVLASEFAKEGIVLIQQHPEDENNLGYIQFSEVLLNEIAKSLVTHFGFRFVHIDFQNFSIAVKETVKNAIVWGNEYQSGKIFGIHWKLDEDWIFYVDVLDEGKAQLLFTKKEPGKRGDSISLSMAGFGRGHVSIKRFLRSISPLQNSRGEQVGNAIRLALTYRSELRSGIIGSDFGHRQQLLKQIESEPNLARRIEIAEALKLDTRPIRNGLLDTLYVAHDMEVKEIVNGESEPKRVFYKAAGVDVSNVLLSTNAAQIDFNAFYFGLSVEDLMQIKDLDLNFLNEWFSFYKNSKFITGYAGIHGGQENYLLDKQGIVNALAFELSAMGIRLNQVQVDLDERQYPRIRFRWAYPGEKPRWRSISFIEASEEPNYQSAYDIFYMRAGQLLPHSWRDNGSQNFITEFNPYLVPGGFYVTDDIAGRDDQFVSFSDSFPFRFPEIVIPLRESLLKIILPIRKRYYPNREELDGHLYGWDVRIRQKPNISRHELRSPDDSTSTLQPEAVVAGEENGRSELRAKISQLLPQFGKEKLDGLNITDAARVIGSSQPGLSQHLQKHPEDFEKYGILKPADIPALLAKFGKEKLDGLNITEAASVIAVTKAGLSLHLQKHPEDFETYGILKPADIPVLLAKFGKEKLDGLNITEAAGVIGSSVPGLSLHLQKHPEDFEKYGIRKGRSELRLSRAGSSTASASLSSAMPEPREAAVVARDVSSSVFKIEDAIRLGRSELRILLKEWSPAAYADETPRENYAALFADQKQAANAINQLIIVMKEIPKKNDPYAEVLSDILKNNKLSKARIIVPNANRDQILKAASELGIRNLVISGSDENLSSLIQSYAGRTLVYDFRNEVLHAIENKRDTLKHPDDILLVEDDSTPENRGWALFNAIEFLNEKKDLRSFGVASAMGLLQLTENLNIRNRAELRLEQAA